MIVPILVVIVLLMIGIIVYNQPKKSNLYALDLSRQNQIIITVAAFVLLIASTILLLLGLTYLTRKQKVVETKRLYSSKKGFISL